MASRHWSYCSLLTLLTLLTLGGLGPCLAVEGLYSICSNSWLSLECTVSWRLVITHAWYGNTWKNPTDCGSESTQGPRCVSQFVDDILNVYCFGHRRCRKWISDRDFYEDCQNENNVLGYRGFCVRENAAHRLCETQVISNSSIGYIFGYSFERDCQITFKLTSNQKIELQFTKYHLSDKVCVRLCGNNMYIKMCIAQNEEANCRNKSGIISITGEAMLYVDDNALRTGYGFLLRYIVYNIGGVGASGPPAEVTEASNQRTGDPGSVTSSVSIFNPGVTRLTEDNPYIKNSNMPASSTQYTLTIIIVIVCGLVAVVIIVTTVVVFLLIRKSRHRWKHDCDVQTAAHTLSQKEEVEQNSYM